MSNLDFSELEKNCTKELDSLMELELSEVKATDKIEPPKIALMIGDSMVSTLGNITTLTGKAKSRKSFLISVAVASAINKDYVFDLLTSHLPKGKRTILLFDTEQSKYHVQLGLKRVCEMIGISNPENLKVYGLRKYSNAERMQIIEYAVYNTPDLGIVFIDGAKDVCSDFMSAEHSNDTVSKFMKWTEELDISLVTVLHQNKSDTNARGHLGSELVNKSETVISVTKAEANSDISIVEPIECRNKDFKPFAFEINEYGIPTPVEDFELKTATKKQSFDVTKLEDYQLYQLLTEIYSNGTEFYDGDLVERMTIISKQGKTRSKQIIARCRIKNWLFQDGSRKPWKLNSFKPIEPNL